MKDASFRTAWLLLCLCVGLSFAGFAQDAKLVGKVVTPLNQPLVDVNISVEGTSFRAQTDEDGRFSLTLPSENTYRIIFTHAGYARSVREMYLAPGRTYDLNIKMVVRETEQVDILGEQDPTSIDEREGMMISPISMEEVQEVPLVTSIEGLMKSMPGVTSNSEFSSQYNVRGGNFDENLVYVNGIEIYRPFLARSGQQEGLGFSNPSMAQGLKFSTGGFGANYGDKLSSVLDITYRQPTKFAATAELGLLNTNLHVEGTLLKDGPDEPGKLTYLMGARRFTFGNLLNTLETDGEYSSNFLDYQGLFTYTPKSNKPLLKIRERRDGTQDTLYRPTNPLKITSFVAWTRNRYSVEPSTMETTFGTLQQPFRLLVGFEGREITAYNTTLGALMVEHQPTTRVKFDYILSAYRTQESELFDLEGGYLLGQVNNNLGSEEFNETDFDLGIGSIFRSGRNYLDAQVYAAQFRARWVLGKNDNHRFQFGVRFQHQDVQDDLKEYVLTDSAGYVVNENDYSFNVNSFTRGNITLSSNQYKAFIQDEWQLSDHAFLLMGVRGIYNDLLDEWLLSPRGQLLVNLAENERGGVKTRLKIAGGLYVQPPFYRELRRLDGTLNLDIASQQSIHAIVGLDHQFQMWNRPFRLTTEAYYKWLYNLIPYEIDNIRIRYYPDEVADGFAYGTDVRVNGEFIPGVDSWVSVGLLKTMEDVRGDEEGYVSRPTDQRLTFAMYFQDELPIDPTFKVHLNYTYGSGMRVGIPGQFETRTDYKLPAYHRADLGFSKLITFQSRAGKGNHAGLESIWATFEVFNLLQKANTISYIWVEDLDNNQYGVPSRLSGMMLNLRVIAKIR
ncbi:TonB-dependent receptor [Pontibacter sp. G13]|uniref:TonB-dependent receptor n=1 Tax=Pontibacter sp. G13 TaxID=3074898 RepID=UPI00288B39FB|nr:TonB-dependent receptor [Pontibacter sp. G13]WNJ19532.1 TonB-dependent receptor [Pontibacter sp. G13]